MAETVGTSLHVCKTCGSFPQNITACLDAETARDGPCGKWIIADDGMRYQHENNDLVAGVYFLTWRCYNRPYERRALVPLRTSSDYNCTIDRTSRHRPKPR